MFGKKKIVATKSGIKLISKTKRESFLPEDEEWIKSNRKSIVAGKKINHGAYVTVYNIKGNNRLVVKASGYKHPEDAKNIARSYYKLNMEYEPLLAPIKAVKVTIRGKSKFGLVQPKVDPCNESIDGCKLTDAEIETLRRKIIMLSHNGFVLNDRIQVGRSVAGRPLQFDLDAVFKDSVDVAFATNDFMWNYFLLMQGKPNGAAKYGSINRNEAY